MTTESPQEYRHRAEESERLARIADNDEVRATLLCLARRWRDFAAEAEAKLKPSQAGAPPEHPSI